MPEKFEMEYFTDPLCCWSWGMEPQFRKLKFLLRDRLSYRYIMGGLLRDWNHFEDPLNNVSRPTQLGPLWMEAKYSTGQFINENIWIDNPVDTSYLACMAVKAAEQQSFVAGEAMLRELREAVMMNRENIGEIKVILDIAAQLEEKGILDQAKLETAMYSDEAADLFRKDLEYLKIKGITRFPSFLISYKGRTLQITGYRPFEVLLETFKVLDPDLEVDEDINQEEYFSSFAHLTEREKEEVQKSAQKKVSEKMDSR